MRKFTDFCSEDFVHHFYNFSATKNTNTRDEYISYINMLCNFTEKDFLKIDSNAAQRYLDHMNNKRSDGKLSRKTIAVRLACYNQVALYMEEKVEGYKSPYSKLIRPDIKAEFDPNRIPTMKELDLLFTEAKKDPQDFLILALATRVGLSATSILHLSTKSIFYDQDKLYLHFEPKDDFESDSYIRLPDDVQEILEQYLVVKNIDLKQKSALLKNKWGNPLSIQNIDQLIKRLTKKCDLEEYTLKDFRNRAILEMANAGATKEQLEQYTGLKSLRLEKFILNKALVSGDCPAELVNYRLIAN